MHTYLSIYVSHRPHYAFWVYLSPPTLRPIPLPPPCVSFVQLLREEQEARMVDIFGIPFNVVIPDGGAGGEQGTGAREAQQVGEENEKIRRCHVCGTEH